MSSRFLGFIKEGKFHLLKHSKSEIAEEGTTLRFTTITMMAAELPEHRELSLAGLEGKVLLIEGEGGGGDWIYSAQMIGVLG
jgi:hypothetical protein